MTETSPDREPILLYGAGRHARVVAEAARASGVEVLAFLEDGAARDGRPFFGGEIIAWDRFAADPTLWPGLAVGLAVGDNAGRAAAYARLKALGRRAATVVHPAASVSPSAVLGEGAAVLPLAVVHTHARIGVGAIINSGAVAEHDATIGEFAHLSPGSALGGGVTVGARAHLGLGAVVLPDVTIGDDARVGAGAVVISAVPAGATVVGVPARVIRTTAPGG